MSLSSEILKAIKNSDLPLDSLMDRDDDVRASAASALTPVADVIVDRLPVEMQEIVTVLWECLGDLKDDLSSSVGSVLDLLCESKSADRKTLS